MMDVNVKDVSIYGISKEGELDSFSILRISANLCEVTCEENADYYDYQSIRIKTDTEKKYTFKIKQAGTKDWSIYDTVCIFLVSEKNICMLICKNISQKFNELKDELTLFFTNPTMVVFDESYHNSELIMVEYLRKYYSHPIYRGTKLIRFPDIGIEEEESKISPEAEKIVQRINEYKQYKEDTKVNNLFKGMNFTFGEIKTDQIKYSFNGIAFKNVDGTYSTYDINTNTLTNVSDLIMDIPIYVMPAAIKDIKIGDIVIHKGIVYVIKEVKEEGFTAIQPNAGTMATLIPEKSIFGFDYMSRVMNVFAFSQASAENPFGNMLPFFVMNKESDDNTLALMMMMQGNQNFDKIMPFMLMGKENINPMTMMMLMNFNK